jgi:predicted nucleic acid-binding protein
MWLGTTKGSGREDPSLPKPFPYFPRSCRLRGGLIPPPAEHTSAARGGVLARSFGADLRADTFARMPKPRIYVETTIPSACHTSRTDPKMVMWRATTRKWWQSARHSCELLVSDPVLKELGRGRPEEAALRLALVKDLDVLVPSDDIRRTANLYVQHRLMPDDPEGDALHLAIASHHHCDVLVTWNYHHLANLNKLDRIKRLNENRGLFVPRISTPLDLLEEGS